MIWRILVIWCLLALPAIAASSDNDILQAMERRGFSVEAIAKAKKDCGANTYAMVVCSTYDYVAREIALDRLLGEDQRYPSAACKKRIVRAHEKWLARAIEKCSKSAEKDVGAGGTAIPIVSASCSTEQMDGRIKKLMNVGRCSPCSRCMPPKF